MKNTVTCIAAAVAFTAFSSAPARAEAISLFEQERPVSNEMLNAIRGGTALFATMTRGRLTTMADAQARSDFRFLGASGQYQMDIWWGTEGSELIATTVRAQTR